MTIQSNNGIIQRLAHLRQVPGPDRIAKLQGDLGAMDRMRLEGMYAGSVKAGTVFLQDAPGEPNCVLETVVDSREGDSSSALYLADPLFADRARYLAAREELIEICNDLGDAPIGMCAVIYDPVRCRPVEVRNLPLMQLYDIVKVKALQFMGHATVQ